MSNWGDRPAVWPPPPTEDVLTTAGLSDNGQLVQGWVRLPTAKVWAPKDGDLLWLPPSATKATDIDRAGSVVEVQELGDIAWVQAQLDKREKYLDYIKAKVRAGAYRLTAALAAMWNLPLDEDGAELTPRVGTGTVAYKSAHAEQAVAEGRRLAGWPIDPDTNLPIIKRNLNLN